MFKSLHGCALLYLSDACQSTRETSHRLRSSSTTTYVIPRTRTRLGDRAFDVAEPRLWNNLPASLRSTDSIAQFRKQLKTYLFRDWGCGGLVTLVFRRRTQIFLLTYLLTYNEFSCKITSETYSNRPQWIIVTKGVTIWNGKRCLLVETAIM